MNLPTGIANSLNSMNSELTMVATSHYSDPGIMPVDHNPNIVPDTAGFDWSRIWDPFNIHGAIGGALGDAGTSAVKSAASSYSIYLWYFLFAAILMVGLLGLVLSNPGVQQGVQTAVKDGAAA